MLGLSLAGGIGMFVFARPSAAPRARADALIVGAVVACTAAWATWLAWPSLLPLGSGPDLTHHLLLIGYIEKTWRLVHDLTLERFLGEMTQYTPGAHVLAAVTGAWMGTDGLHALHPLQSATLAMKAGFLTAIALRALPPHVPRVLAVVAVVLLVGSPRYFVGEFTEYGFLAQAIAEVFVIAMWWTLVVWDAQPDRRLVAAFGVLAVATFLTWPVYTGAPVLACVVFVALQTKLPLERRVRHLVLAVAPLALVGGSYLVGRLGWLQLAGTGGAAPTPSLANLGLWLVGLGIPGVVILAARRSCRATKIFAVAIALEGLTFFALAHRSHAPQPYMALKMVYLFVWPLALAGMVTVATVWSRVSEAALRTPAQALGFNAGSLAPLALVTAMLTAVALPLWRQPSRLHPRQPAVSEPLLAAAVWARTRLPASCIEYLTGDEETAYWIHLAVLGNPRISSRTGDNATYRLDDALVRWLTPGGLPYAIVDLTSVPSDVRDELDIVRTFGTAAVAKRRTAASCGEQP